MNDLHWIKYLPSRMIIDTSGMSPLCEQAHRRLFDYTLENDGPYRDDNEKLKRLTLVEQTNWARVKGELLQHGWKVCEGYFSHRGTIETLNESKSMMVSGHNRTCKLNNLPRLKLVPNPEYPPVLGVFMVARESDGSKYVASSVTDSVTPTVSATQLQPQSPLPEPLQRESKDYSLIEAKGKGGLGEKPRQRSAAQSANSGQPQGVPLDDALVTFGTMGAVVAHIIGNSDAWDYDNSALKVNDFTPGGLKTVLTPFLGKLTVRQAIKGWQDAALITNQAKKDGLIKGQPAAYCTNTFKKKLEEASNGCQSIN